MVMDMLVEEKIEEFEWLREIYQKIVEAAKDGEMAAINVYAEHESKLLQMKRVLDDIFDIVNLLKEALIEKEKRRERGEYGGFSRRSRGGCFVVKYVTCGKNCRGCPHGPYLYHVVGVNGKKKWTYLGRVG